MLLAIRDRPALGAREPVPLAGVVAQAVTDLRDVLTGCGGRVEVEVGAQVLVRASRAYLYSIFFNLLSNAVKYRAPERPLLVRVTATAAADGTEVVVADNGLGFDRTRAGADVFKLYQRFHPTHPGRGLGLYLVKTHLQSLGGHIDVRSEVNQGTQFTIWLP